MGANAAVCALQYDETPQGKEQPDDAHADDRVAHVAALPDTLGKIGRVGQHLEKPTPGRVDRHAHRVRSGIFQVFGHREKASRRLAR
ncbi:MAG: hypothetical protein F4Z28_10650 [Gammaproteobacteria bacterium]|nr:hypothetical protein [Gammaproteobacteria bacterium]